MAATEYVQASQVSRLYFTQYNQLSRTVADGVTTNASTTVTSATAVFVASDVGATIVGTGIPAAATIASVTNSTTVVISAAATVTGTAVSFTITRTGVNAVAAFSTQFNTDWTAVLGATVQALATTLAPTVAIIPVASTQVLTVNPTDWVGYNNGVWQVLTNTRMISPTYIATTI